MKHITLHATEFAGIAHHGQTRDYSGDPYIWHPIAVASEMSRYTDDTTLLACAILHDVIEDTEYGYDDILERFGLEVAEIVLELTNDPFNYEPRPNRAFRRAADAKAMNEASVEAQFVRIFDIGHNLSDIASADPKFAKMYMGEKRTMVDGLTKAKEAYPEAWAYVDNIINEYYATH